MKLSETRKLAALRERRKELAQAKVHLANGSQVYCVQVIAPPRDYWLRLEGSGDVTHAAIAKRVSAELDEVEAEIREMGVTIDDVEGPWA